jgi:hypothetical protein
VAWVMRCPAATREGCGMSQRRAVLGGSGAVAGDDEGGMLWLAVNAGRWRV